MTQVSSQKGCREHNSENYTVASIIRGFRNLSRYQFRRILTLATASISRCFTQDEFPHPRSLCSPHCTSLVTGAFVLRDRSTWGQPNAFRIQPTERGRFCCVLCCPVLADMAHLEESLRASENVCRKGQKPSLLRPLATPLSKVVLVSG